MTRFNPNAFREVIRQHNKDKRLDWYTYMKEVHPSQKGMSIALDMTEKTMASRLENIGEFKLKEIYQLAEHLRADPVVLAVMIFNSFMEEMEQKESEKTATL